MLSVLLWGLKLRAAYRAGRDLTSADCEKAEFTEQQNR